MYLRSGNLERDISARVASRLTVLFGTLGLITGSAWSRVTWGAGAASTDFAAWWVWDPKQVSALICVLLYGAYFLLRSSFEEPVQKARISAVYNIFATASIYPLFYILPRALDGLHPGAKGEGSTIVDMSPEFYRVFWPAVLGFIMLAVWLLDLSSRIEKARHAINEMEV
jgi:heme exporter protein C